MSGESSAEDFTDRAVSVFRDFAQVPVSSSGRILPSPTAGYVNLEAVWSQKEMGRGKKISYCKSYFVNSGEATLKILNETNFQSDCSNIVKVSTTSNGSWRACLVHDKKEGDKGSEGEEPQQFIEIWKDGSLRSTIPVADLKDTHGKINEDIHFGSFHLSEDGRKLLYVAEKKKPKAASFFDTPSKEDPPPIRGAEHDYQSNWGEQLSSVVCPVVVVMDVEAKSATVIDTASIGDISAGQARWVPGEEEGVVFIAWENFPRKLGFVYCLCRRSSVCYANLKTGECKKLTDNNHTVFSPRFNQDGSRLVYLHCEAGGPHHPCSALKMIRWADKAMVTVVDVVQRPQNSGDFPGFYAVFLPDRCWDNTGTRLLLHNQWGSLQEVVLVDTDTFKVTKVSGDRKGAWVVLDVFSDLVVAQFASLNSCPAIFIGRFPDSSHGDPPPVKWVQVSSIEPVQHLTKDLIWEILTFTTQDLPYEALLLRPSPDKVPKPGLVVFPHGGPHVAFSADFMVWPVCLAALGFAVVMVNYRGSMGFGQECIDSLPGKVGTQDVQDVQNAATTVLARGVADEKRVCVIGGSHGGFLSAHLIGQFPEFYCAAAIRNPVIDMATIWSSSDIPDWCCCEGGVAYNPAMPPSSEDIAALRSKSPIIYASKVCAPVMLHLGGKDLRCPPSQGLLYYHTLKAQKREVRLLFYPKDSHPISTVNSDADAFINTAVWFHEKTSKTS